MNYRRVIEQYYKGFRDRDRAAISAVLSPNFHFVSGFGEFQGRDSMLDAIWPSVGQTWAADLRIFGEGPDFVVLYRHENAPGAERPPMTMAEYVHFEDDRIAAIEVFVGRPLKAAEGS
jgi:hypothetical protein